MKDFYAETNSLWPQSQPAITREEARRAAAKLMWKFARVRRHSAATVRRCWIQAKPGPHNLRRGWPRLIHDLSHRVHRRLYPNPTSHRHHNAQHAEIECDMVKYVLARGWMNGTLMRTRRDDVNLSTLT